MSILQEKTKKITVVSFLTLGLTLVASCEKKAEVAEEDVTGSVVAGTTAVGGSGTECEGEGCDSGLSGEQASGGDNSEPQQSLLSLTVAPMFPTNGSGWFSSVKYDGAALTSMSDTACNATADARCYYGGELRKVAVSAMDSCANLTMEDSLGVYKWRCFDEGSSIYFYSYGFQSGKGLKNLLNATSWKPNLVTLKQGGTTIGQSTLAPWFSDTVMAAPTNPNSGDGVETLATNDTIYTVASSTTSDGYNINGNRIALVTLEGATLTYTGNASDNCNISGETSSPTERIMICSGGQQFIWVELNLAETGTPNYTERTIDIRDNTYQLRVHATTLDDGNIYADNVANSRISDLAVYGKSGSDCLRMWGSSYTIVSDSRLTRCDDGISMWSSANNNVFHNINISNANSRAVWQGNSTHNNIFSNITISANSNGFYTNDVDEITLINFSGTNQVNQHIDAWQTTKIFGSKISATNNAVYAIYSGGADTDMTLYDVAISHSSKGIYAPTSGSTLNVKGDLKVGNFGDNCDINAGVTTNIDTGQTTCTESDAELTVATGQSLSNSFAGAVTNDSKNADTSNLDGDGFLGETSIADWLNFDSPFTVWGEGQHSGDFTHSDHKGTCAAENCGMWSLESHSSDTVIRNYTGATLPCPASVSGNDTLTDLWATSNTFLRHAFEIVGDGIGNENGLCESNEECVFSPNMGSYQGSGDYYTTECSFTDGTLTGITLYAYPTL